MCMVKDAWVRLDDTAMQLASMKKLSGNREAHLVTKHAERDAAALSKQQACKHGPRQSPCIHTG